MMEAFLAAQSVNNPHAIKETASNAGDVGSIPGQEDPLEKAIAIHSGILAWEIPWTEEPGRQPSVGLQE